MKLKYIRAFTLVELMVVIVIIGILAGIVVANIGSRDDDARRERVKADFRALADIIATYKLDTGTHPEKMEDFIEPPEEATGWRGPYLRNGELPRDPWEELYKYERYEGSAMYSYVLTSFGPNRKDDSGKEDDITNVNPD